MKMFSARRRNWSLVLLSSLCLLVSPAFADDDDDDDDDDFTPVSECGTIISSPGHYKLINDLVDCNVEVPFGAFPITAGVAIDSNRVDLDLNGFTISCLGRDDVTPIGVVTQPGYSKNRIRNGTVTGCALGVLLEEGNKSRVKNMTLTGGFNGVQVFGGSKNKISNNTVFSNVFGIDAFQLEDSTISCNLVEGNFVHGLRLGDASTGNKIRRNVTNGNFVDGITVVGFADAGFIFAPVPTGNVLKGNTSFGNGNADLTEGIFDFAFFSFDPPPGDECPNKWKNNQYGTQFPNVGCIPASVVLEPDDDDDCDDDDDDDDYDDDDDDDD